jgi:hypothetical protein
MRLLRLRDRGAPPVPAGAVDEKDARPSEPLEVTAEPVADLEPWQHVTTQRLKRQFEERFAARKSRSRRL